MSIKRWEDDEHKVQSSLKMGRVFKKLYEKHWFHGWWKIYVEMTKYFKENWILGRKYESFFSRAMIPEIELLLRDIRNVGA